MAARLQITEWLEGEPAGDFATPTPRDTLRPAPEPTSPSDRLHHLQDHLTTASELLRRREREDRPPPLPTGSPWLDRLLGGGLPRGHLVELVGGRTSGRFSVALALLAAATQAGEAAALVDLGEGLDPEAAATAGIELERLLWLGPRSLRQALAGAEMLVTTGFPLVVVDLGLPPVRRGGLDARGAQAAWLRLARAAGAHATALFVSAPYRASGAAAAGVLTLKAEAGCRGSCRHQPGGTAAPSLLLGIEAEVTIEKARPSLSANRCASPGETERLRFTPLEALLHPLRPAPERRREARPEAEEDHLLAAAAS